jgi:hypothetical protein
MHPWYLFNFGKCKSCLTFYSSGPSCWAFSILILLHHTCALIARCIYHSYLNSMSIRLLNRKLLGALNSCTTLYTGLHPLLMRPSVVTMIQIKKDASHFAILEFPLQGILFSWTPEFRKPKRPRLGFSWLFHLHDPSLGIWGQFSDTHQDPIFQRIRGQRSTVSQLLIYVDPTI